MDFLSLALLGVAVALAYSFYYNTYSYWERRGVPHERPLPLLGNMFGIGSKYHFRDINQRIYSRFKGQTPFAGMFTFLKRTVLILEPELIKQVLVKDFNVFEDRGIFNNVRDDPLTGHLLTLEGDEWRSMRHKLTPVFTSGKMKQMCPVVVEVAQRLTEAVNKAVDTAAVEDGDVEMKELCARFTTDVIGTCAFGLECNSLLDPQAEFRAKGRLLFEKPRNSPIVQFFMFANPKVAKKLRLKLLPDDLAKFFMEAVRTTVDYRQKNNIRRNDFLDQMIQLRAENEEAARQGKGIDLTLGLTIEQIAAQAFVFFVAGFETSSSTMNFCLYELALQPAIQQRLRDEIEAALKVTNGELTYEVIHQMAYLDQVLAETLRKHPIVAQLLREANQNYTMPGTQVAIEKGTSVMIPVHSLHHDPDIYPNPEHFDPARFEPKAIEARHSFTYLPFGDGPRNCIGLRFGKMQAKIGLISLLRHFKFSASQRTEKPLILDNRTPVLSTKKGIILKVERI